MSIGEHFSYRFHLNMKFSMLKMLKFQQLLEFKHLLAGLVQHLSVLKQENIYFFSVLVLYAVELSCSVELSLEKVIYHRDQKLNTSYSII